MKCKPILFSTPMVQAILDGRKTMTRRVINPQPVLMNGHIWNWQTAVWPVSNIRIPILNQDDPLYLLSRYKSGDILWVRETWFQQADWFAYKADNPDPEYHAPWRPSIHMPKAACRIWLRVTDVRVERLQEISEEDAKAEGLKCLTKDNGITWKYGIPDKDGLPGHDDCGWYWSEWCVDPREAFHKLWDSINAGIGFGWDTNPWVWVITFERVERPEGWMEARNEEG